MAFLITMNKGKDAVELSAICLLNHCTFEIHDLEFEFSEEDGDEQKNALGAVGIWCLPKRHAEVNIWEPLMFSCFINLNPGDFILPLEA